MGGTASIDQSKLSQAGQRSKPKLKAGRWRKVKVRVSREASRETGLSAAANQGSVVAEVPPPPNMYIRSPIWTAQTAPSSARLPKAVDFLLLFSDRSYIIQNHQLNCRQTKTMLKGALIFKNFTSKEEA